MTGLGCSSPVKHTWEPNRCEARCCQGCRPPPAGAGRRAPVGQAGPEVPGFLPWQGWGTSSPGWPCPGATAGPRQEHGGVKLHVSRSLCPCAGPSPGGSGGLPPAQPAFSGGAPWGCAAAALTPPPLPVKLGTQSSDAFDAGLPRLNSLTWIFFILDSSGKAADGVSLSLEENCGAPSAMQGGSTVKPWQGEPGWGCASSLPGRPPAHWVTLGKSPCRSMPQFPHL